MPFDPDKAFTPISLVADMSMLVVVHPKVGVKTLERVCRARARQSRQAQFRIGRRRHHRPPRTGAVDARGQDQGDARALSRRGAIGDRPDRRPDRRRGRQPADGDVAHQGRHHHSARRGGEAAPGTAARRSDRRRGRAARLGGVVMVRRGRAGRHAAGDRQASARGNRQGGAPARPCSASRRESGARMVGNSPTSSPSSSSTSARSGARSSRRRTSRRQ